MSISVSRACIGAGLCIAVAPEHFEFYRGRARKTEQSIDNADAIRSIRSAAEICPTAAITTVAN
ncbi:ferredoxin [Rhodococcoides fascians]|uniref:ferredoxin n=1 Tax=Rhodococcoides fascians TaxID=1828 RepID=UPI0009B8C34C|nr:ferredoxin [Rhodococcus sp. 15-1189-1-1a]OZF15481.1 ferredoxin [Rhodococcus sp. 14-2686-1-2]